MEELLILMVCTVTLMLLTFVTLTSIKYNISVYLYVGMSCLITSLSFCVFRDASVKSARSHRFQSFIYPVCFFTWSSIILYLIRSHFVFSATLGVSD